VDCIRRKVSSTVEGLETDLRWLAAARTDDDIKSNVAIGDAFEMSASKQAFTSRPSAEAIGVSIAGAFCPGLNAEIRAVVGGARAVGITLGDRP
jgi:hypothetical protein